MKTRNHLALAFPVLIAVGALASASCTGAEAPPASAGFWIQLQDDDTSDGNCGLDGTTRTLPANNASVANTVDEFATPADLEDLELIRDGADDATVECTIKELAVGSYEIDARFAVGATTFELQGSTGAMTSAGYRSPQTAGDFLRTNRCTLKTALAAEGGGEAIVVFNCPGAPLPHTERVCLLNGAFYARDCKN